MNGNDTKSFWLSIGAAILAMALLYSHNQNQKSEYHKKYGAMKRVVVASKDIRSMETLDETQLTVIERPAEFTDLSAVSNPDDIVGQVTAAPIKKGEVILTNKLFEPGPDTGISLQVAPNRRAVSLPVDKIRGISKLIKPGDRIDIIASLRSGKGPNQVTETKTLMQDVTVLATGKRVVNNIPRLLELDETSNKKYWVNLLGDIDFDTITIETTPKEAQDLILILTDDPSRLYMTLRNPNDRLVMRMPSSMMDGLVGRATPEIPSAVPAAPTRPTLRRAN